MPRNIFSIIILAAFLVSPLSAENRRLSEVEAKRDRGFDYLDIYTTGYVKGKGLLLEDKLVIDLSNTSVSKNIKISKRKSKRISDVRVKQLDKNTARIVVYLKKDIDYEIVNVFGRNKSVVEISDRTDRADKILAAWEKANLKEKGQKIKAYKYKPVKKGGNLPLKGKIIVIDPGHGGRDPGAFSLDGIPEKTFNLQTARKTAYLLKLAGATVYLTRNSDRKYNLRDIVKFANKTKADIFISIHYNYSGIRSASGTETFYYKQKSRNLALNIHRSLIRGIKRRDRGLRKAMLYVCNHTNMPSALVEPVYISNPKESSLAKKQSFQKEVAAYIVKGVKNYFRSRDR
ncbi:MAG: N-acetylmuramoyl-L-alanine amidase [Candidatus Margulisiibacteriota bacterium]|nr:N-acetylmuramoyl-L-alanine amidase [Candidatus Margulisiibacteriota bacterium]